jgi:hypothetical protein
MKRDMELIRALMLAIDSKDGYEFWAEELEVSGDWDITEIKYHLQLINDVGFISANIQYDNGDSSPHILIDRMSWNGHEFLDNTRNESVWKETVKVVKEKGGSMAIGILTQVAASLAKQHMGLS